jgi:hypothetical protein
MKKPETPERIARANRQRLAAHDATEALAKVEKDAVAVRQNMERLRALRLQKEAEEPAQEIAKAPAKRKKRFSKT